MSSTYTYSRSQTFTITNAKYLANKVGTDLMRLHRYYYESHGSPSLYAIQEYYTELVLLQQFNFLDEIEYGFAYGNEWVKALQYKARQGGVLITNDDPGGIGYCKINDKAEFASFLRYNSCWDSNSPDKQSFLRQTPIRRESGNGYSGSWTHQSAYSSGGRGLLRSGI